MKRKKQKGLQILKLCGILLLLGLVLLFAFRNAILDKVIHRIDAKMANDYQCNLTVQKAEFYGLANLELQKICLVPKK